MSEYSESVDPLGHVSGTLRVPQEMMRTYSYLRDYLKREMVRMLTAEGRGADAHLAHLATGEMVLPRKLLDDDPWLRTYLVRVFEDACLDWRTHIVGGPNRLNPATGLPEFDVGRDEGSDAGRGGYGFDDGGFDSGFNAPGDVDERTGFDVDHRDPTGGGDRGRRDYASVPGGGAAIEAGCSVPRRSRQPGTGHQYELSGRLRLRADWSAAMGYQRQQLWREYLEQLWIYAE